MLPKLTRPRKPHVAALICASVVVEAEDMTIFERHGSSLLMTIGRQCAQESKDSINPLKPLQANNRKKCNRHKTRYIFAI